MIIILSSIEDPHAVAVADHLKRMGAEHRIVNLSEFPMQMDIGLSFATSSPSQLSIRLSDGTRVDFGAATAVWWRRPQPFGLSPTLTDPVNQHFAQQECDFAFKGMYAASASKVLWMNNVTRDAEASHKPWQLHLAGEIGLDLPLTLITNNPEEVRRFREEAGGKIIYKAFLASAMAWRETRLLRDEDLSQIEAVRLAPVIFQRYIEAVRDLRVTVVGRKIFAAAAETQSAEYAADIRMNPGIKWQPYDLPEPVASKLLELMDRLDLQYGAVDFRVKPDGTHVFLEINPAGQFLFVENATSLPIGKAVAERLAEGHH